MRNPRIRQKLAAALLALVALWAFAAYVTVGQGLDLLELNTIRHDAGRPTVALVSALQRERRASMVYLGDPGDPRARAALAAARAGGDRAEAGFLTRARAGLKDIDRSDVRRRIRELIGSLSGLDPARGAIDAGVLDRGAAADVYDDVIDGAFRIYAYDADLDDRPIARTGRTLIALSRAKEILSREDAVLAGAIAAGHLTAAEHMKFAELSGTSRYLTDDAAADLPDDDRARYDAVIHSPVFTRFRAAEDRVERFTPRPRADVPPISAAGWAQTVAPVESSMQNLVLTANDELDARSRPGAVEEVVQLVLAGGLGLVAVVAAVVVAITTTRDLMRQLEKLRNAARELAERRLPGVVERLGRGETVDVTAEAPPLAFGTDAIGQVGHAFNSVQETAIRTAVEQAELRRGIRDVLLSLARRSQALVHRQITLLDEMERDKDDPKDLEELFRVDHLATRMRRNAENLIILSGATPARGWRRPVPMIDVVRSAVAEVENYTRIEVSPRMGDVALAGRAVGDLVHLLAELIENGVAFSPPGTSVQVTGRRMTDGYAVEVEDHGLGMTDEILATVNRRIADPPEFNLAGSAHLGLFVVGRLAERYDVRVSLEHSSHGGTKAIVVIPHTLIEDAEPADATPNGSGRGGPAAIATAPGITAGDDGGRTGPATAVTAGAFGEPGHRGPAAQEPEAQEGPTSGPNPDGRHVRASVRRPGGTGASTPRTSGRSPSPGGARQALPPQAVPPRLIPSAFTPSEPTASGPRRAEADTSGPAARPEGDGGTRPAAGGRTPDGLPVRTPGGLPVRTPGGLPIRTPGGLPVRTPDASAAGPAQDASVTSGDAEGGPDAPRAAAPDRDRSPERVRRSVGGLQAATRRARDAVARGDTGPNPLPPAGRPPDDPAT